MSDRISPTAHATGYIWAKNGLSPKGFATREGALMVNALRVPNAIWGAVGGPVLEDLLLARHRTIDHLLEQAIDAGEIGQVIEIAAGLSPRGCRFAERYGDRITYLETDLPGMAARKRALLERIGRGSATHRVVELDAMADDGPQALATITAGLDPDKGLAIITEGLVNYFDETSVRGLWTRFAKVLGEFSHGLYLSDIHIGGENSNPVIRLFTAGLSAMVRGRVHLHFADVAEGQATLTGAGFETARLHRPGDVLPNLDNAGARVVRVIEART